jgi:hypothetical protein
MATDGRDRKSLTRRGRPDKIENSELVRGHFEDVRRDVTAESSIPIQCQKFVSTRLNILAAALAPDACK